MSGLELGGKLASLAGGQLWKAAAIALLALQLVVAGGMGFEWWSAAHDRDAARADLGTERTRADALQAGIREQNRAMEVLTKAKADADARGATAQQLAAANGRRFDGALQQLAGARAATCADAMPYVNQLLESVR